MAYFGIRRVDYNTLQGVIRITGVRTAPCLVGDVPAENRAMLPLDIVCQDVLKGTRNHLSVCKVVTYQYITGAVSKVTSCTCSLFQTNSRNL